MFVPHAIVKGVFHTLVHYSTGLLQHATNFCVNRLLTILYSIVLIAKPELPFPTNPFIGTEKQMSLSIQLT